MIHNACCCGGGAVRRTTLAELEEGSIIRLAEGDSLARFIVAKHDYESGLNGTGRTLVVRKDCHSERLWNEFNGSTVYNNYGKSAIDIWLNGDYKALLDADIQPAIGTTKFRYTPGNGNTNVGTLERAIFLLSITELGKTANYANTEGSALDIASSLQIAYLNGSAINQWTRSPDKTNTEYSVILLKNGNVFNNVCNGIGGIRPAFTLPSTIDLTELGVII